MHIPSPPARLRTSASGQGVLFGCISMACLAPRLELDRLGQRIDPGPGRCATGRQRLVAIGDLGDHDAVVAGEQVGRDALDGVGAVAGLGFVQILISARSGLLCRGCVGRGRGDIAQRDFQRGLAIGLQDVAADIHDVADFGVRNLLFGPHEVGGGVVTCVTRRPMVMAWLSSTIQ